MSGSAPPLSDNLTPDVFQTAESSHSSHRSLTNSSQSSHFCDWPRTCLSRTVFILRDLQHRKELLSMQGNATTSPPPTPAGARWSPGFSEEASPPRSRRSSIPSLVSSTRPRSLKFPSTKWPPAKFRTSSRTPARSSSSATSRPCWCASAIPTGRPSPPSARTSTAPCSIRNRAAKSGAPATTAPTISNGRVVSGPPPKPLEELAVKVRGDEVVISKRV